LAEQSLEKAGVRFAGSPIPKFDRASHGLPFLYLPNRARRGIDVSVTHFEVEFVSSPGSMGPEKYPFEPRLPFSAVHLVKNLPRQPASDGIRACENTGHAGNGFSASRRAERKPDGFDARKERSTFDGVHRGIVGSRVAKPSHPVQKPYVVG
jgi:hypothetical protein